MKSSVSVRLCGVNKSFVVDGETLDALQWVDFHVLQGEFVSIIGPSGCGKTTLLNIISGLEQPDGGDIELEGRQALRRLGAVGYMQQKDLLMPWRTVLDNAILGLELRGVSRNEARARAMQLTGQFGLTGFENQYPFALSGGMRQRVAFLRTILIDTDVVLLDEPFGALDALTRTQMQQWLLDMWQSLGKTILMVTHDVDEAVMLSDRVCVLTKRPGRVKNVVDVGLPRPRSYELITDPSFTRVKAKLLTALWEETSNVLVAP